MVAAAGSQDPATHGAGDDPRQRRGLTLPAGRALARNALYNLLGQTLPILVGLAAIPITVRALGEPRFGLLGLAWAVLGYAGALDLGLGRATTKFVAEYLVLSDHERLRQVTSMAIAGQTLLGVLGGALLAVLAPQLVALLGVASPIRPEATAMFRALALSVPIVVLAASLRAVLEAAQRFDLANLIRTPASAAVLILPAIAATLGATLPAIVGWLLGVRLLACVASIAAIPRAIPGFRWRFEFRWRALRPLLGYGGWVSVSNVVSPLLVYLERFLLASIVGLAAVAYYTAPSEAALRLLILPAALAGALFPALSASWAAGSLSYELLLGRPVRFLSLAFAPIVTALIVCAKPLLALWLGEEYAAQSTTAFIVLAIGVFINGLAHLPYAYLLARGRPDVPAKFHLLELPLYAAAAWWLIARLGVTGAAVAWTLRVTVDAMLLTGAVWRLSGVRLRGLLGERGGNALVAVGALGAAGAITIAAAPASLARFVIAGALVALFGAGVWRFVLDQTERMGLLRVLR